MKNKQNCDKIFFHLVFSRYQTYSMLIVLYILVKHRLELNELKTDESDDKKYIFINSFHIN